MDLRIIPSLYNMNCAIKEYSRKLKYSNVHGSQRDYKMPVKRKTHLTSTLQLQETQEVCISPAQRDKKCAFRRHKAKHVFKTLP